MFKIKKIIDIQAARKPNLVSNMRKDVDSDEPSVEESAIRISRCLFGKCDPDDTMRMLEEQIGIDKARFMERFGIDIDHLERADRENTSPNVVRKTSEPALKKINGNQKRKILPMKGIRRITDFYKVKKARIQEKENNPS